MSTQTLTPTPTFSPQKIWIPGSTTISKAPTPLNPHRHLATLLHRCVSQPHDSAHQQKLNNYLNEKGETHLVNPVTDHKTSGLLEQYVQQSANGDNTKVHPVLSALHQVGKAFGEIRKASSPFKGEHAIHTAFQKLESAFSSISSTKLLSQHSLEKGITNAIKTAFNLVHKGVEALAMQKHHSPKNDAEAKQISQAMNTVAHARDKFANDFQKVLKFGWDTAQNVGQFAVNFIPGGQVKGIATALTASTQLLVKAAETIQQVEQLSQNNTPNQTVQTVQTIPASHTAGKDTNKSNDKTDKAKKTPIQTAQELAHIGTQVNHQVKQLNQKKPHQLEHEHTLKTMPRTL